MVVEVATNLVGFLLLRYEHRNALCYDGSRDLVRATAARTDRNRHRLAISKANFRSGTNGQPHVPANCQFTQQSSDPFLSLARSYRGRKNRFRARWHPARKSCHDFANLGRRRSTCLAHHKRTLPVVVKESAVRGRVLPDSDWQHATHFGPKARHRGNGRLQRTTAVRVAVAAGCWPAGTLTITRVPTVSSLRVAQCECSVTNSSSEQHLFRRRSLNGMQALQEAWRGRLPEVEANTVHSSVFARSYDERRFDS